MFQGSIVALVTPMNEAHEIDFSSLAQLIDWHIASGTDAIVVNGTTGEAATLSEQEAFELIEFTVKHVADRLPVIAGTFANATTKAIALTRHAMELGVDACLLMTPAYIKPTQEGLFQHYSAIAHAVPIPIILYNVPSRTACDMLPETVAKLASVSNIIGIKEATGDLQRLQTILNLCQGKLDVYSGDDASACEWLCHGAQGVISVTANVAPALMHQLCEAALKGDHAQAENINQQLAALHRDLFIEANPIPLKWALYDMQRIAPYIRMPLTWLSTSQHAKVKAALELAK